MVQNYSAMVAWVTVHLFRTHVQVFLTAQYNRYKSIYNIFWLEGAAMAMTKSERKINLFTCPRACISPSAWLETLHRRSDRWRSWPGCWCWTDMRSSRWSVSLRKWGTSLVHTTRWRWQTDKTRSSLTSCGASGVEHCWKHKPKEFSSKLFIWIVIVRFL